MTTTAEKRAVFRELHQAGCFVLPNPWDIGSAHDLAKLGFPALATTSSGAAAVLGRADYELGLGEVLDHIGMIAQAVDLPVNADFENGFADAPDMLASNVAAALETGIAGLSIEDRTGNTLYPFDLAVERIVATRSMIDEAGGDAILVARTEAALLGEVAIGPIIARLTAMAEAGADCLYAPGLVNMADIAALVRAVAPRPVNVLYRRGLRISELADIGVRRVSVGGTLAGIARRAANDAARQLLVDGCIA